ncbi:hypothetical protein CCR75_005228 [Bremia lactucae]|uniref:Tr-type G domain-containing protein n=1 Tax=Bremia lactucae TaxID=4779 RepID=A0A976FGS9_BRELC|nr:hypothetical protein CCR75_005228 [Bremia lactucae]
MYRHLYLRSEEGSVSLLKTLKTMGGGPASSDVVRSSCFVTFPEHTRAEPVPVDAWYLFAAGLTFLRRLARDRVGDDMRMALLLQTLGDEEGERRYVSVNNNTVLQHALQATFDCPDKALVLHVIDVGKVQGQKRIHVRPEVNPNVSPEPVERLGLVFPMLSVNGLVMPTAVEVPSARIMHESLYEQMSRSMFNYRKDDSVRVSGVLEKPSASLRHSAFMVEERDYTETLMRGRKEEEPEISGAVNAGGGLMLSSEQADWTLSSKKEELVDESDIPMATVVETEAVLIPSDYVMLELQTGAGLPEVPGITRSTYFISSRWAEQADEMSASMRLDRPPMLGARATQARVADRIPTAINTTLDDSFVILERQELHSIVTSFKTNLVFLPTKTRTARLRKCATLIYRPEYLTCLATATCATARTHYDEYSDDVTSTSPTSNEFMYRRNSPSRQQSVFSFVHQEEIQEHSDHQNPHDTALLDTLVPKIQEIVGSSFVISQIIHELRNTNYDVDKTVVALLENGATTSAFDSSVRLEEVALGIENNETVTKKSMMPAPAKGKTMAIGQAMASFPKKSANVIKPLGSVTADTITGMPVVSRTRMQCTLAEKKAFERAELKTQNEATRVEEAARSEGKTKISMVVIGHVDAGKSTITGHLLYQLGYVSQRLMHKYEKESREAGKSSFAYAWVMDADDEERARGVTMDVGTSFFETSSKHVTLLDAPGHRDFIPKMIAGAAQADVAMLVVPAVTGEFEAAFEHSGQTKEHMLLVRSLGVSQIIVAVNKMDMVHWNKDRFDAIVKSLSSFLYTIGFRLKNLRFVPLSGLTGVNLEKTGKGTACAWYTGPSLVDAIDTFASPPRQIAKPFRMTVSDVSKSMSLGLTVSGRIYAGAAAIGDSFLLMPVGLLLSIKGMEQDGQKCRLACAGDTVEIGVSGIDHAAVTIGSILCSIASPVQLATKFEAKIMTMPALEVPLVKGTCVTIHMHNVDEPAHITRLVSMQRKKEDMEKKRPRCIPRECSGVVHITCDRKVCIEEFAAYRQLGRFTLRDRGKTLAAGIVTQIIA